MQERNVPEWLIKDEPREILKDNDAFVRKSADALAFVLEKVRRTPVRQNGRVAFSTPVKLGLTFLTILLVSAARNFAFVEILGVALLARIAAYDAKKIARILALPIQAVALALLILAPSLFWGQTRAFVVVPCKTFITTASLAILAYSTNWNRFTCAFKSFGAPDALVFIFDLTLKYIVVLSEICLETIEAVRLRSVGRNRRKARTLGGIVGVAFLRAQKMAQEQFDAMTCRCFSGNYRRFRAPMRLVDWGGVVIAAVMVALFAYLEWGV